MKTRTPNRKGDDIIDENNKNDVVAILPHYDEEGKNCSKIIFKDGKTLIRKTSVKATTNKFLSLYGLELNTLRRHYGRFFDTIHIPVPVKSNKVLVPLRFRSPIGKHDGAIGCLDYSSITGLKYKDIEEEGKVLYIGIKTGDKELELRVYQKYKSTSKRLNQAQLVLKLFNNEMW